LSTAAKQLGVRHPTKDPVIHSEIVEIDKKAITEIAAFAAF
jgi:hypothetical protein